MASVIITKSFDYPIELVWEAVTNLDTQEWRSDISKIEELSNNEFIEYTKDNYQTKFTITAKTKYELYSFDIENDNIKGNWQGIFKGNESSTTIEFTEDVTTDKLFMKLLLKPYLKKQQATYIKDLEKYLDTTYPYLKN